MRSLAVVIVSHRSAADLGSILDAVGAQTRAGDEVVVVDAGSDDGSLDLARGHRVPTAVVDAGGNVGYGGAANLGAARTAAGTLLFLNADVVPGHGFLDAMRGPPPWAGAWMGLLERRDGTVDTRGGVVHLLGFAWSAGYREPAAGLGDDPVETAVLSGACFAVPRATFDEVGGFWEPLFMYHEDVDLSLRLRRRGVRLALVPAARATHEHDLDRGDWKWWLLERNRMLVLARCWPAPLLVTLLPALVAAQVLVLAVALRGGWLRPAASGFAAGLRGLPSALRSRPTAPRGARTGIVRFVRGMALRVDRRALRAGLGEPAAPARSLPPVRVGAPRPGP